MKTISTLQFINAIIFYTFESIKNIFAFKLKVPKTYSLGFNNPIKYLSISDFSYHSAYKKFVGILRLQDSRGKFFMASIDVSLCDSKKVLLINDITFWTPSHKPEVVLSNDALMKIKNHLSHDYDQLSRLIYESL